MILQFLNSAERRKETRYFKDVPNAYPSGLYEVWGPGGGWWLDVFLTCSVGVPGPAPQLIKTYYGTCLKCRGLCANVKE